ncbi:Gfo/Idh/MocA family oxidoreductase [Streptomyces sp. NPDC048483]|uniref:Gfo/Idh/MocA family protein n=1 Tax=Streptomyces sp. NPDC048483 TaxID=3154927 RepID=UPI003424ADA1
MAAIGVVGLVRGLYVARWCARLGVRVVALCDTDEARITAAAREFPGARTTSRWRHLLAPEAGLDGVVLAHDFDRHAEAAVAFLDAGIHVLSETAACTTEREGRALVAAAERSAASYAFAENYVAHAHVRAIGELVRGGAVGAPQLIESDYVHAASPEDVAALVGDPAHWRGRISPTEYCTHALSPVLDVTGTWPVEVSAFPVTTQETRPGAVVLMVRLSDGGLALTRQTFLQGEPDSHWHWFSVRGSRGLAESVRAAGERSWNVRVRRDAWTAPKERAGQQGAYEEELVPPPLRIGGTRGAEPVAVPRHDEGTALIAEAFRACMEEDGAVPRVGVREAVAASLVGTAATVSLREHGRAVAVADVRSWT